jgi:hypothetical protein
MQHIISLLSNPNIPITDKALLSFSLINKNNQSSFLKYSQNQTQWDIGNQDFKEKWELCFFLVGIVN